MFLSLVLIFEGKAEASPTSILAKTFLSKQKSSKRKLKTMVHS